MDLKDLEEEVSFYMAIKYMEIRFEYDTHFVSLTLFWLWARETLLWETLSSFF